VWARTPTPPAREVRRRSGGKARGRRGGRATQSRPTATATAATAKLLLLLLLLLRRLGEREAEK
jgi:hypothetical protein